MTYQERSHSFLQLAQKVVELYRKLDHIFRYSTTPMLRQQTVSEHSFHVAHLAVLAAADLVQSGEIFFDEAKLIKLALFHDVSEGLIGDILYPIKKQLGEVIQSVESRAWSEFINTCSGDTITNLITNFGIKNDEQCFERRIVSICDMMELVMYLLTEMERGNRSKQIQYIFQNGLDICEKLPEWELLPTFHQFHRTAKLRARNYQ